MVWVASPADVSPNTPKADELIYSNMVTSCDFSTINWFHASNVKPFLE